MINTAAITPNNLTQSSQSKQQAAGASDFTTMLASKEMLAQLTSDLLDNLLKSRANSNSGSSALSALFPFSSEFESTFGTDGPLPAFINEVTMRLNLSAEQNQALQNIAIRNKDITKTPENVQRVAAELKTAGIG